MSLCSTHSTKLNRASFIMTQILSGLNHPLAIDFRQPVRRWTGRSNWFRRRFGPARPSHNTSTFGRMAGIFLRRRCSMTKQCAIQEPVNEALSGRHRPLGVVDIATAPLLSTLIAHSLLQILRYSNGLLSAAGVHQTPFLKRRLLKSVGAGIYTDGCNPYITNTLTPLAKKTMENNRKCVLSFITLLYPSKNTNTPIK